jgi:3(or 17)beta-hydroxysteroid dehydrogenase
MRLSGKTALVTGGASGIGKACAEAMAAEGARVVVTDRDGDGARRVAEALGPPHTAMTLDVTDEAAWPAVIGEAGRIDALVCSAGIGVLGDIEHAQLADFRRVMKVNVEGVFLACRAVFPGMKAHGGGSIVILSSVAGLIGEASLAAYCASKGAVRLLAKSIAMYGARAGVRCNSVHPSFIDTPMVEKMAKEMGDSEAARDRLVKASPMGRLGRPEEIAAMVVYLASDESKFTNGAELVIDGGLTAR